MKKTVVLGLVGILALSSLTGFADEKDMTVVPISAPIEIEEVKSVEVAVVEINGVSMMPLRETLEAFGFKVTWHGDTRRVDLQKGAQWTSIAIGENAYFRARMAPWALSAAPVIHQNLTYVPVEFLAEITSLAFRVEDGKVIASEGEMALHKGYVKDITFDEKGTMSFAIVNDMANEDYFDRIIIHTSLESTFYQNEIEEGKMMTVVSPNFMTMSLPPQTPGYVVY